MKLLKSIIFVAVLLTSFQLSFGKKDYSYHAAGVLPYTLGADGKVRLLLGFSSVHHGKVSDFGGLRDEIDNYHPKWTAAREGCEELMFIFDEDSAFGKIVALRKKEGKSFDLFKSGSQSYNRLYTALKNVPFSVSKNYIMYFIAIDFDENIPMRFEHRKAQHEGLLPKCWDETIRLVWVDIDELFDLIDNDSMPSIKNFRLYKPFVKSLIEARSQGIIAKIKAQQVSDQISQCAQ